MKLLENFSGQKITRRNLPKIHRT